MRPFAVVLWLACLGVVVGCRTMPPPPPPIAPVALAPDCAARLPPIHQQFGDPAPAQVCRLVIALKQWIGAQPASPPHLAPSDSSRIALIGVTRWQVGTIDDMAQLKADTPEPERWHFETRIEADVPGRPRLIWANLNETTDSVSFGLVHR